MSKNQDITLSVIVPCFNVEQYLDMSLHYLERQWDGRTDYEIIFVNDASKDHTIDRLNEFQARYPDNVRVIDKKENGGVSGARNSALDIAVGKWVTFFDPDDILAVNSYARLMEITEQEEFDILRFGVEVIEDGAPIPSPEISGPISVDWRGTSVESLFKFRFGISCCYFYKREILATHRYPQLTICEDTVFNLSVQLENRPVVQTDAKVYYYLVRSTSATNTVNPGRLSRHCDDIFKAIGILQDMKGDQDEKVKQRITGHQWGFSYNLLTRMLLSDKSVADIREIIAGLKKFGLFPMSGGGMMTRMMNTVFNHPSLVPGFRPFYRFYRKHRPQ